MDKYIFISHSSKDAKKVERVLNLLDSSGIKYWISTRDIPPGADWAETIYDAISNSAGMVLLFSANVNDSRQIRNELDIATNLHIPLIPLKIEDVEQSKGVRYFTNSHQWLDATDNWKRASNRLLESLNRILAEDGHESMEIPLKTTTRRKSLPAVLLGVLSVALIFLAIHFFRSGSQTGNTDNLLNMIAGGTDSWDYATDILATSDGGFTATGTWDFGFWSEWWVAHFDSTGNLEWTWSDSLSGECKPELLSTEDAGIIAASGEYADFEHTGYWVRAFRLDSLGGEVWDNRWRIEWLGAIQPVTRSMNRGDSGRIRLAFTLRALDTKSCYAVHVVSFDTAGENMLLDTLRDRHSVHTFQPDGEGGDFFVYKDLESRANGIDHLSSEGLITDQINVGDRLSQASCGTVLPGGYLLILLTSDTYGAGNGDLTIMKFTGELELCWEKTYGGDMWDSGSSVLMLPGGDLIIAGTTSSYGNGSADGWILRLDEEGDLIWQKVVDCGGNDRFYSMSVKPNGNILLAGSTTRFGDPDAWILEISPDGLYRDSVTLGIDLLTEDWEEGFLDQSIWLLGYNRNYSPELMTDSLTGNTSINTNSVPLITRNSFQFKPGLSLSATITVPDRPDAFGSNWVAIGMTHCESDEFHTDPATSRERELQWVYTRGMNNQERELIATLFTDSQTVFIETEEGWLQQGIRQELTIENCVNSVVYRINDSLFCELPASSISAGDSLHAYLYGHSSSLPHGIDDIRLFLRRW